MTTDIKSTKSTDSIKNTKKKIHMIASIIGHLARAKGVKGSEIVTKLEKTIEFAKKAIEEAREDDAVKLGIEAGELLKNCVKLLPKTPRKLMMNQVELICRY